MFDKIDGQYWKTIIDTMLEGLMLVTPDGDIVFINNAFVLCQNGEISSNHLPLKITGKTPEALRAELTSVNGMKNSERQRLIEALQVTGGNRSEAAKILGVSRVTLWKRIKKFGILVEQSIR